MYIFFSLCQKAKKNNKYNDDDSIMVNKILSSFCFLSLSSHFVYIRFFVCIFCFHFFYKCQSMGLVERDRINFLIIFKMTYNLFLKDFLFGLTFVYFFVFFGIYLLHFWSMKNIRWDLTLFCSSRKKISFLFFHPLLFLLCFVKFFFHFLSGNGNIWLDVSRCLQWNT